MRGEVLPLFAALAACASSSPGSAIAVAPDVPIVASAQRLRSSEGPTLHVVPFPLERVWRTLPAVYDSLGVPIDHVDGVAHVIGNSGFKAHKRLGSMPLSKLIDCGNTQGFPSADEYDINLSVLTQIDADTTGATSISTRVEAAGRPMAFAGAYSRCGTKGLLETTIVNAVTRRLER